MGQGSDQGVRLFAFPHNWPLIVLPEGVSSGCTPLIRLKDYSQGVSTGLISIRDTCIYSRSRPC